MILFIDVETTGLSVTTDRIVSIAWAIYDETGIQKTYNYRIIKQLRPIPQAAVGIHGITTERASREGIPLEDGLKWLLSDIKKYNPCLLVAHNIDFDLPILKSEYSRTCLGGKFPHIPTFCTMKKTTNLCRLPMKSRGYKWPKLNELHNYLFHRDMVSAHDAGSDVLHCAKCFFELRSLGYVDSSLSLRSSKIDEAVKNPKAFTPAKAVVQHRSNSPDTGFRRNDDKRSIPTFSESVKIDLKKDIADDGLNAFLNQAQMKTIEKQEPVPFVNQKASPQWGKISNCIGMKLVLIPAGTFTIGESEAKSVTISQPFYMQMALVTQGQWQHLMGNNPSCFEGYNCPVERVSWNDVQEFIQKLNALSTDKYRLPTEVEWEYACRAGSKTAYCFGDDPGRLKDYAWYDENSKGKTHAVAQKLPNAWGLYDMHGNVWEWVQDWYSGSRHVICGGSWGYDAMACRSADHGNSDHNLRDNDLGFRLLRTC